MKPRKTIEMVFDHTDCTTEQKMQMLDNEESYKYHLRVAAMDRIVQLCALGEVPPEEGAAVIINNSGNMSHNDHFPTNSIGDDCANNNRNR